MYVLIVERMVKKVKGESLQGLGTWYTMKYDRRALLPFRKDVDVMKLLKGNDEHVYIYILVAKKELLCGGCMKVVV